MGYLWLFESFQARFEPAVSSIAWVGIQIQFGEIISSSKTAGLDVPSVFQYLLATGKQMVKSDLS
jgi:hypothetical protein